MEKAGRGLIFDKAVKIDDILYQTAVDKSSMIVAIPDGSKRLDVFEGPYRVGIETAAEFKKGANIVVIERPDPESWAQKNCENLEAIIFDEMEGKPRYRVNSDILTAGGHSSAPVYKRSTISFAQQFQFSRENAPPGGYLGMNDFNIFVSKENISLETFFKEHLPMYTDTDRHLVFVVPPGGIETIKGAMSKTGLDKKLKASYDVGVRRQKLDSNVNVAALAKKTLASVSELEASAKTQIDSKRLAEKERELFEVPKPDKRKTDLGWKENAAIEKTRIVRAVATEIKRGMGSKYALEKAAVVYAAGDRMRKCPFVPSGVGVAMESYIPDDFLGTPEIKVKNAAMDVLQEIWNDAPDVVRNYIQAMSDMSGLPFLRHHAEFMWKEIREARADMQEYEKYLRKKGEDLPQKYDPEFIAEMVFYAFPEINSNEGFSFSRSRRELRLDVGEDGLIPDNEKFDLVILEKAVKLYPKDQKLKTSLDDLRRHVKR